MVSIKVPREFARADDWLASKALVLSLVIVASGLLVPSFFSGSWVALVVGAVLFGAGILRLYSIQHDCGHYSFFTRRKWNDALGNGLSVFSGIAHSVLQYNHNLHHAHLGDLGHRDVHEVFVMTRREYESAPLSKRLFYRIYRHPMTLFLVAPVLVYFFWYRWPRNTTVVSVRDVLFQNIAMFAFWSLVIAVLGWWSFFALILGSTLAGSFGIFVVYVGHNFEETYWRETADKSTHAAALHGASSLRLGPVVDFVLLNFGFHDLHHYNAKIPCYHLKSCNASIAADWNSAAIGLKDAMESLRWRLWDEDADRMIPFPQSLVQELRVGLPRLRTN